jgi:4-amino-4-deoxy-L-arabinose transferase-like glycosyltransferase|tara:strand:+ start:103 stop:1251 length:1149 start_codon:yes stop_codon:yes gene_type:complete
MNYDSAVFSILFYLFCPFGVIASRSFQSDGMMVSCLVIALYFIIRYYKDSTSNNLILASIASSLAVYIKAPAIFFVFFSFLSLSLWKQGLKRSCFLVHNYIFILFILILGAGHYWYGLLTGGDILETAKISIIEVSIFNLGVLASWLAQTNFVIGFIPLFISMISLVFVQKNISQALSFGLFTGYIIFSIVFSYHISTHDYYSLPLVPIIALSLGPWCNYIAEQLSKFNNKQFIKNIILSGIIILSIAGGLLEISVRNYDRHGRWQHHEKTIAREIGKLVNHSAKTLFLSISEGYPLQYYGKLAGKQIAYSTVAIEKFVKKRTHLDINKSKNPFNIDFIPEYFIVTELLEYSRRKDLQNYFMNNFPIIAQNDGYIIYDLRKK